MLDSGGSAGRDRVRCVLVGDEPLVAQCADAALANGLDVVLIATTNPVVRDYAAEHGIAVSGPGAELVAALDDHPADVLFSIANLRVLPAAVLDRVSTAVNFHDGPLPGYAGLNVTTWALLGGEDHHAITWHLMTNDVDAGEVVVSETFPIAPDETAFSLNARCYEAALATFPRIAADVAEGTLTTTPQPAGESRMFRRHDRPAVLLDPRASAADSARAIRALDLGHRLRNSIGSVRLVLGGDAVVVEDAAVLEDTPSTQPGTVVSVDDGGVRFATSDGDLLLGAIWTPEGRRLDPAELGERLGVRAGATLSPPTPDVVAAVTELEPAMSRDELFWLDRLTQGEPTEPPSTLAGPWSTVTVDAGDADDTTIVTAVAVWLTHVADAATPTFAVTDSATRAILDRIAPLGRPSILRVALDDAMSFDDARRAVVAELDIVAARTPLMRDALGRDPRTRGHERTAPVLVQVGAGAPAAAEAIAGERLRITVAGDGTIRLDAPADPAVLGRVGEQLATLVRGSEQPAMPIGRLAIVGPQELADLDAVNLTERDHDRAATIDGLFHTAVARHPDAPALSSGGSTLSYAGLGAAVDAMARRLADLGVGRGDRVGIAVPRGVEMIVGVLATLDLGAAYVPLDPTYPADRLGFMVDDAGISVLLATGAAARELTRPGLTVLDPADVPETTDAGRTTVEHDASDLAYVIYTSGSTGMPKGVMLEHGNVTNFFVAMDDVIDHDPPGVWLAVTSLSFDISVLELLWTLTRGFHVVLKSDSGVPSTVPAAAVPAGDRRPVSFSLFYFAAGADVATDGYRLLLESAKWADRNGFEAVWTPERHFHAFGASYPNPSVAGAALAAITTNVGIRAGSVVLPLHSPIRVAEEWAVVDNLSHGRVAISFAAGWQPNDFVLNPTAFANAKEDLPRNIDLVQRLWRGETVSMPGHDGKPVDVRTLPRPVQPELPIWLTSAGSPATFERAGTLGVNVLTHLLGQSVEQLAENIGRYRSAWEAAGHEGVGRVTLMMHTYLDRDAAVALETAREPMKGYLGTAVGLLRDVASAFPTFAGRGKGTDDLFASLTPDELDQLLEVAAARYLGTSGLFGTPADAAAIVEAVSAAGVDEVACLIDFGVATDAVLGSLELLHEAKSLVDAHRLAGPAAAAPPMEEIALVDDSVAALVAHHGVTHLQCTPSLAAMLVADPADRASLGQVGHLMLGGEALPAALASELRGLLPGRFTNMYGPTETTIWSLTQEITEAPSTGVPIGGPIANTTIFVLDHSGGRLPFGAFGELHIGGEGVARGYHDRPELTAERFVDRPGMGRVYATGDVVRIHPAGYVEFAGRSDNQVKIRGHRIELGEIESVLDHHPDVVQSVVVARDDRGDTRLVAYVILHGGAVVTTDALRKHVAATLPEAMVPSAVVTLTAFPLTPNGKIDRKALPADVGVTGEGFHDSVAPPADDVERLVAEIWSAELERPVGRDDNFFDIGGHSLLAVKVFRRLTDATQAPLALTDVFRFPTVRAFARHLGTIRDGASTEAAPAAPTGTDRGAMRRRALARRGGDGGGS